MLSTEPFQVWHVPDYDQEKSLEPMFDKNGKPLKPTNEIKARQGMRVRLVWMDSTDEVRGLSLGDEGTVIKSETKSGKLAVFSSKVLFDNGIINNIALHQVVLRSKRSLMCDCGPQGFFVQYTTLEGEHGFRWLGQLDGKTIADKFTASVETPRK